MSASNTTRPRELVAEWDEGLAAVPFRENGRWMVRYSIVPRSDLETESEPASTDEVPESVRVALSLAGAWSDLDWNETVDALDRIRKESVPTPPIAFDEE